MTRIKICGLQQPEHIALCTDLGVDAVGVVFVPQSPRAVSIAQAKELVAAAGPLTMVVGLFLDAAKAYVDEVLAAVALDRLQFHGREDRRYCEAFGRPYLKAVGGDAAQMRGQIHAHPNARGILVDSHAPGSMGGTGQVLNWRQLAQDIDHPYLVLAGGLTSHNVAEAISILRPTGVEEVEGHAPRKTATVVRGRSLGDSRTGE